MAKPYTLPNEVQSTIATGNTWTRGTDTSIVLTDASDFDSGGGYIRIGDATSYALMEYTGISTNTLTGLTACTLGVVVSSGDTTKEWPAGTAVSVVFTAEKIGDIQDEIDTLVEKSLFDAHTVLAATTDDTPAALTVGEQTVVGRITGGNIAALTVAQLQTLALGAALPENVSIQLDPALSADGKYSGITETGTAGATLAFGDLCYLAVADSRWELAKADVAATSKGKLGICVLAAASDGSATTMLMYGKVRADTAFPTFTVGAPVFISAATAGDVTSTAPTGTTDFVVRIIGSASTADSLFFNPDCSYAELA